MKSYISRKLPLVTRSTARIRELRSVGMTHRRAGERRCRQVSHHCRRLAAQPQSMRVVKWLETHGGSAHLAEDIDLEALTLAGERRWHVPGGETLGHPVAVGTRGHVTHGCAVLHDGLIADDLDVGAVHLHDDEAAFRAAGSFGERRGAAVEVGLAEIHEAVEARFS